MHLSLSFCFINIFASFSYSFSFLGIIKLKQKITGLKGIDYKKKQRYKELQNTKKNVEKRRILLSILKKKLHRKNSVNNN